MIRLRKRTPADEPAVIAPERHAALLREVVALEREVQLLQKLVREGERVALDRLGASVGPNAWRRELGKMGSEEEKAFGRSLIASSAPARH